VAKRLIPILLLAVLSACAATPTQTATPQVIRVATTSTFEGIVSDWVTSYTAISSSPSIEIVLTTTSGGFEAVETGEVELFLEAVSPPIGWFSTPVITEDIAVIVHPDNPLREISLQELAQIFNGGIREWDDLDDYSVSIQPVVPIRSDSLRHHFEAIVFTDETTTPNALLAPSPEAMLAIIAENTGAIGYTPASSVDRRVRVLRVERLMPAGDSADSMDYPLRLTILAIAQQEPTGGLRDWLVWLQSHNLLSTPKESASS
jgi:phosphate transport system substrate-binding protein